MDRKGEPQPLAQAEYPKGRDEEGLPCGYLVEDSQLIGVRYLKLPEESVYANLPEEPGEYYLQKTEEPEFVCQVTDGIVRPINTCTAKPGAVEEKNRPTIEITCSWPDAYSYTSFEIPLNGRKDSLSLIYISIFESLIKYWPGEVELTAESILTEEKLEVRFTGNFELEDGFESIETVLRYPFGLAHLENKLVATREQLQQDIWHINRAFFEGYYLSKEPVDVSEIDYSREVCRGTFYSTWKDGYEGDLGCASASLVLDIMALLGQGIPKLDISFADSGLRSLGDSAASDSE